MTRRNDPGRPPALGHAPDRIVLFGEGHEELGLPVIAAAVGPGVTIRAHAGGGVAVDPRLVDAARATLADAGLDVVAPPGLACDCDADRDPMLGERAALAVALLRALLAGGVARGEPLASKLLEPRRLAGLAWQALRAVDPPVGRADVLACALGGLHHFGFGPTPFVQALDAPLGPIWVFRAAAAELDAADCAAREEARSIVTELLEARPELDLSRLAYDEAWNLLLEVPARGVDAATRERRFFSLLQSRDLLLAALQVLAPAGFDEARRVHLAELLERDHQQRRAALRVEAPGLDRLHGELSAAGALGAWKTDGSIAALGGRANGGGLAPGGELFARFLGEGFPLRISAITPPAAGPPPA